MLAINVWRLGCSGNGPLEYCESFVIHGYSFQSWIMRSNTEDLRIEYYNLSA